jgi:ABC-type Mn2+/Zn2+ transport system ATPase subunit
LSGTDARQIHAAENARRVYPTRKRRFSLAGKRPVIGWLAQRHALEAQFPLTVRDVVSMGWPGISLLSGFRREARLRIQRA